MTDELEIANLATNEALKHLARRALVHPAILLRMRIACHRKRVA